MKTDLKEGYLPRVDVGDKDVFIGAGIVEYQDGSCNVLAINTRNEDVTFEINPREIVPFEYDIPNFDPETDGEIEKVPGNRYERINRIKQIIRTDHLNTEEIANVHR